MLNAATTGHKRGDTRADGLRFWAYTHTKTGMWWVSPEKFLQLQEKRRVQRTIARRENPEPIRAAERARRRRNRDGYRARALFRKQQDPEKLRAYVRAARVKRLEEIRAYDRQRRARQIEKFRARDRARSPYKRAKRRGQQVALSPHQRKVLAAIYTARNRISTCMGVPFHVDHVVPMAKGGLHTPSNLQLLPWRINLQKGAKLVHV